MPNFRKKKIRAKSLTWRFSQREVSEDEWGNSKGRRTLKLQTNGCLGEEDGASVMGVFEIVSEEVDGKL